ncbi:N-acetylmuramidase domain-containing protein [Paraburkholderia sediminicola]|uniref:N-acetylmuramidase domain-containing protein n=1 Tax=Paraburkholderia rhynchosiae TaxID=487049 RepID=A0ACC7NC43_9BURK
MAMELNVEVAAIKAIVMQESQGHPFLENGLPPILYERRHFFELVAKKRAKVEQSPSGLKRKGSGNKQSQHQNPYPDFPDLCFPHGDNYGPDGLHQYEKLVRAANLDLEISLMACSWGGFQILGEYYSSGCATIFEFVNKFISGTDGQAEIFIAFMKNMKPDGVKGLQARNWEKVADSYSGSIWRTKNPDYASNLAKYYDQFK